MSIWTSLSHPRLLLEGTTTLTVLLQIHRTMLYIMRKRDSTTASRTRHHSMVFTRSASATSSPRSPTKQSTWIFELGMRPHCYPTWTETLPSLRYVLSLRKRDKALHWYWETVQLLGLDWIALGFWILCILIHAACSYMCWISGMWHPSTTATCNLCCICSVPYAQTFLLGCNC